MTEENLFNKLCPHNNMMRCSRDCVACQWSEDKNAFECCFFEYAKTIIRKRNK